MTVTIFEILCLSGMAFWLVLLVTIPLSAIDICFDKGKISKSTTIIQVGSLCGLCVCGLFVFLWGIIK